MSNEILIYQQQSESEWKYGKNHGGITEKS